VVNTERLPAFPDLPTAKEVGYPGLNVYGWQGVSGAAKLPKEIVDKWEKALAEACKDPAFLEQAAKIYKVVAYLGPKEFWEFMQEEYKRYLPLAIKMGIRK
jgi:tripartite-type tricarboxylate transporter receptor subunit TctC